MSAKRLGIFGASLALTGLLLYLALRNAHLGEAKAVFLSAKPAGLLAIVGILFVEFVVRAARWKILVDGAKRQPFGLLYKLEFIGIALNNVLPFRLGELGRAYLLSKSGRMPMVAALSTVAVERVLDMGAMVFLLSAVLWAGPELFSGMTGPLSALGGAHARTMALLLLVALAGGTLWMVFLEDLLRRFPAAAKALARWPKVDARLRELLSGAKALRSPGKAAAACALSVLVWLLDALAYYAGTWTVGLAGFGYLKGVVLLVTGAAATALPVAPGYFGAFEFLMASVLRFWGYPPGLSAAFALFIHLAIYLTTTVAGLLFLHRLGSSLAQVWLAVGKEDAPKAP